MKIRKESKALIITDDNREFIRSLLNILELKEAKKLGFKKIIIKNGSLVNIISYKTDEGFSSIDLKDVKI